MTHFTLSLLAGAAVILAACGGNDAPETAADIQQIEANASAELADMKPAEMIDYLNEEALAVTDVLKTVTDKASAEAAIDDLRARGPKLAAAFKAFENIDENEISFGLMRKLPKVMQTQAGLVSEMGRISEIPEARAVIETELDKLELPK
ncbi:hypothetical protein [Litorimonas sp. WD9-15]|uniref:hypothetical protein n=1 Tax=Litorimonas sp. WD9-15 TaxID=3418716 RepID=UPI003D0062C0